MLTFLWVFCFIKYFTKLTFFIVTMLENILSNIGKLGKLKLQVVELCFEPGLMSELQEGTECLEHKWQGKS